MHHGMDSAAAALPAILYTRDWLLVQSTYFSNLFCIHLELQRHFSQSFGCPNKFRYMCKRIWMSIIIWMLIIWMDFKLCLDLNIYNYTSNNLVSPNGYVVIVKITNDGI